VTQPNGDITAPSANVPVNWVDASTMHATGAGLRVGTSAGAGRSLVLTGTSGWYHRRVPAEGLYGPGKGLSPPKLGEA
jgi:hypothetical protein